MLFKAILTGGTLAVLAGAGVYYGTEGAETLERDVREDVRLDSTELAGAAKADQQTFELDIETVDVEVEDIDVDVADVEVAVVEVDPPAAKADPKPKTKWLDQYLKKSSKKDKADKKRAPKPITTDSEIDATAPGEENLDDVGATKNVKKQRKKARADNKGSLAVSEAPRDETSDLNEHDDLQGDFGEVFGVAVSAPKVDYDVVIEQADKLLVVDMRDQAYLEILDYAIDRNDMTIAADLLGRLSSPELRDTGRARLGKGLALRGKAEAAFAVLEEIEIDELAAPIRLEIISALMTTQKERISMFYPGN